MPESTSLDRFGRLLMTKVRDWVIEEFDMVVEGKMKDARSMRFTDKLRHLHEEDRELLRSLIVEMVDATIFQVLVMAEEQDDIDILVRDSLRGELSNIRDLSDGLGGELFTEDGWISRFSQYGGNNED